MAAAVAMAARDLDGPAICCQVLLYPGLDRDMGAQSIIELSDAPMLSLDDIVFMHELADNGSDAPHDPYRVPAYARDLAGLPPAIVATAECDPIRDWGERYAARLRDARVQVTVTRYPGVYHGFLMRSDATTRGRLAIAEVCALLRAKFDHPLLFPDVPITGHRSHHSDRCDPQSNEPTAIEETIDAHRRTPGWSCPTSCDRPRRRGRSATSTHDDQRERLLDVVRTEGPWKLIIAQHFASAEELMATMSGMFPEGFEPSLDLFLTPTFRGYLANYGAVLYPELHDLLLQRVVPEHGQVLLGRAVRETAVDAVQHQRAMRQPRSGSPRLAELPRRAPRERAHLAVQRDGQVGPVHRLPDQDGAGDHVVLAR